MWMVYVAFVKCCTAYVVPQAPDNLGSIKCQITQPDVEKGGKGVKLRKIEGGIQVNKESEGERELGEEKPCN